MDDNGGMGMRNWGYFDNHHAHLKGNLGLQLMSSVGHDCNATKTLFPNGGFLHRDCGIPEPSIPMDFVRPGWLNYRDNKMAQLMMPLNYGYTVIPENHCVYGVQMMQQPEPPLPIKQEEVAVEESIGQNEVTIKKRSSAQVRQNKTTKPKKPKKLPADSDGTNGRLDGRGKILNKCTEVIVSGIKFDISKLPPPVCSCTGSPQQCYRWGIGGWQSACCTTNMSIYPLPMSTKRRGARIAGRKMSQGAFTKVLEKLSGEGYELSNPIDLRTYWAKHGTNKFVTIRPWVGCCPRVDSALGTASKAQTRS